MSYPASEPDLRAGVHQTDRWRGVQPAAPVVEVASIAPPLVANDFLFFVVDERSGKLAVAARVAGFGCAAALLSELVLGGNLAVQDGQTVPTPYGPHREHRGAGELWREIAVNPQHRDTRTWLEFFAPTALERVASRMAAAGLIRVEQRRALSGKRVPVYLPTDVKVSGFPTGRVHRLLTRPDQRTSGVVDQALVGLCAVTGAIDRVLWDPNTARVARTRVAPMTQGLHPYLRDLLATTKAAVGDAVLVRR